MKNIAILIVGALASCTSVPAQIEPLPGSIIYGGQPRTKLTKVPIGSGFNHEFRQADGSVVEEHYIVQPDRSLRITSQRIVRDWPD